MGDKLFRDPVHGYIKIPSDLVSLCLDTPIFQRLKSIEQTSYRTLFHCASHDRFAHSLGVYHLSDEVARTLIDNTKNITEINMLVKDYSESFKIAALMHDCAHAPFSHTLECFYGYKSNTCNLLLKEVKNRHFSENIEKRIKFSKSYHEIMSAYMYLTCFAANISNVDHEFVVRMIIGSNYENTSVENQIKNIYISLLNGKVIDVDKLDYLLRDTWATGINNMSIDLKRLISAISCNKDDSDNYQLSFKASSAEIIEDVSDAQNILKYRIVSHHKVVYYQRLLKKTIQGITDYIDGKIGITEENKSTESSIIKLFGSESFINDCKIDNNVIYLPSDGDIMYLLKNYMHDDGLTNKYPEIKTYIEEILYRKSNRKALWKDKIEYFNFFSNTAEDTIASIGNFDSSENDLQYSNSCQKANELIDYLTKYSIKIEKEKIMLFKPNLSQIDLSKEKIYIEKNKKLHLIKDYCKLKSNDPRLLQLFYVYVDKEVLDSNSRIKEDIIKALKSFA